MKKRTFLELAKALQSRPKLVVESIPEKTTLSEVHIPTKYLDKRLDKSASKELEQSVKAQSTKSQTSIKIKMLSTRKTRQLSESISPKIAIARDKKVSKIDHYIHDILQSPSLVSQLKIDKWRITRMVLSSNERICYIYWELNNSFNDYENRANIEQILSIYQKEIQKRLISMAIRRSGSIPLKFIPRITFKRDKELEIQGKLDDIFSKLQIENENKGIFNKNIYL